MSQTEKQRLNRLDSDLRREGEEFLAASGLGLIIAQAGYQPVGSYVMHTMTWRDLDFERMADEPDWDDHWRLGQALARIRWVWWFSCVDAYRGIHSPGDTGYYWGLRASDPDGGPIWKVDLWTARPQEFAPALERRARWQALMTEARRLDILAIKEAVCTRPEYRKTMLSVHIYEAVLEQQIREIDAFLEWWSSSYGDR